MSVRILTPDEFGASIGALCDILIDAVDSGAGVSFMQPLAREDAERYWEGLAPSVAARQTLVFAGGEGKRIDGTVQLIRAWPPNQPHRCDMAKLLVHRRARRRGLGEALVRALEAEARRIGLTLITFDAVTGGQADRFYRRLGFTAVGDIPGYALLPNGDMGGTTIFYRAL